MERVEGGEGLDSIHLSSISILILTVLHSVQFSAVSQQNITTVEWIWYDEKRDKSIQAHRIQASECSNSSSLPLVFMLMLQSFNERSSARSLSIISFLLKLHTNRSKSNTIALREADRFHCSPLVSKNRRSVWTEWRGSHLSIYRRYTIISTLLFWIHFPETSCSTILDYYSCWQKVRYVNRNVDNTRS